MNVSPQQAAQFAAEFETKNAEQVLAWALQKFHPRIAPVKVAVFDP